MRALIAVALLLGGLVLLSTRMFAGSDPAAPVSSPPPQEAGPLATVHALFDGMRAKDTVALRSAFHADARLVSTSIREGETVVSTSPIEGFIRSIGRSQAELDERIRDEHVLVDGPLASVWTPYAFYADGEFSHCGVNAFQIVRTADGWKILQITDTRRTDACPPGEGTP